jgi:hypothetical protein
MSSTSYTLQYYAPGEKSSGRGIRGSRNDTSGSIFKCAIRHLPFAFAFPPYPLPLLSSPLLSSFLPVLWPAAGRAHLLAAGRSWRRRGRSWSRSSWWWRSSWRQERRRRQGMPRCRRSSGGVSCSGSGRCTATSTVSTRRRSPALRYLPLPTHPFRPSHHGARSLHPCLSKISFSFVSL